MSLKKTTIIDLSQETGYSIATISRALNDSPLIRKSTKKLILAIATKLNYIPNLSAQNLVKKSNKTIGLLVPENSQLYYEFYLHFQKNASSRGYHVIISYSNNISEYQDFHIQRYLKLNVSGIVIAPIQEDYKILQIITNSKTPFVIINSCPPSYQGRSLFFNFQKGIEEAVSFLMQKNKKYFYHLTRKGIYYGKERRHILKNILEAHHRPYNKETVFYVDDTIEAGYLKMKQILLKRKQVDAVLCSSDQTAIGAMRAIIDQKKQIPKDVAVVGCYNTHISNYLIPRLSTIATNIKQIADHSLAKLFLEIEDHQVSKSIQLDTSFLHRETT